MRKKLSSLRGTPLQAVRDLFAINAALAAEGAIFLKPGFFPQPLYSLLKNSPLLKGTGYLLCQLVV
jgi:hypothetical protein